MNEWGNDVCTLYNCIQTTYTTPKISIGYVRNASHLHWTGSTQLMCDQYSRPKTLTLIHFQTEDRTRQLEFLSKPSMTCIRDTGQIVIRKRGIQILTLNTFASFFIDSRNPNRRWSAENHDQLGQGVALCQVAEFLVHRLSTVRRRNLRGWNWGRGQSRRRGSSSTQTKSWKHDSMATKFRRRRKIAQRIER